MNDIIHNKSSNSNKINTITQNCGKRVKMASCEDVRGCTKLNSNTKLSVDKVL